jgi:hypothetical protein
MKKMIITVFCFYFLLLACSKNNVSYTADCSTTKYYAADVSPIILSYCAKNSGCHANGSSNRPGALTIYAQVYNAISDIRKDVANGSMPRNGSLTNDQKNAIICWIDSGAPNN